MNRYFLGLALWFAFVQATYTQTKVQVYSDSILIENKLPPYDINTSPINVWLFKAKGKYVGFLITGHSRKDVCEMASREVFETVMALRDFGADPVFSYGVGFDAKSFYLTKTDANGYHKVLVSMKKDFEKIKEKYKDQVVIRELDDKAIKNYAAKMQNISSHIDHAMQIPDSVYETHLIEHKHSNTPLIVPFYDLKTKAPIVFELSQSLFNTPSELINKNVLIGKRINTIIEMNAQNLLIRDKYNPSTTDYSTQVDVTQMRPITIEDLSYPQKRTKIKKTKKPLTVVRNTPAIPFGSDYLYDTNEDSLKEYTDMKYSIRLDGWTSLASWIRKKYPDYSKYVEGEMANIGSNTSKYGKKNLPFSYFFEEINNTTYKFGGYVYTKKIKDDYDSKTITKKEYDNLVRDLDIFKNKYDSLVHAYINDKGAIQQEFETRRDSVLNKIDSVITNNDNEIERLKKIDYELKSQYEYIDAFLRGWGYDAGNDKLTKKLSEWYERRPEVWATILKKYKYQQATGDKIAGVFHADDVFFRIEIQGNNYLITPYKVLGGNFVQKIDKKTGICSFYTPYNFR